MNMVITGYVCQNKLQSAPVNSTTDNSFNQLNSTISCEYTLITPYVKSNPKFDPLANSIKNLRVLLVELSGADFSAFQFHKTIRKKGKIDDFSFTRLKCM